ncbi:hypothetical protein CAPTEDRAFT_201216 [Capitella teleta]|uniref:Ubiquitin carboxyl-terminal hydrolase MINDY n=1 Tax=Capitella teleta TaxID=283909 RepID=R7U5P1_CAPTE|nr:hypothetical protein CAPTEDRAFT_201216 [Capitella teleta]|eukprot:ELU01294.1 hypothetical protein CAPTEDRAFT_201216 [Capitella teleta]
MSIEPNIIGGKPISHSVACELRRFTCGSNVASFGVDWKKTGFHFYSMQSPYQFGLHIHRDCTRGLLMCVQAYLIKKIIFKYSSREEILRRDVLHPSEHLREEALVHAISEMIWQAGQGVKACVCLLQDLLSFEIPPDYRKDGFTEKLTLFEFSTFDELRGFIKIHKDQDSGWVCGSGSHDYEINALLNPSILEDSGETELRLLNASEECSQTLLNLLLTGKAVQYIFNGTQLYDDEGERLLVGSMLKTPKRPIWVTITNRVNYGLLFSTNPDLVSDWRVEHRFFLHYYTGLVSQKKDVTLTIDTRFGRRISRKGKREADKIPAMEHLILSKWSGAEVDWNGTPPFM